MPSRPLFPCALASALVVLTLSRASFAIEAETTAATATEADGYSYTFKDDALKAGGLSPTDPRLHVVIHAARSLLIRPRTHFIAEMLKSVENL